MHKGKDDPAEKGKNTKGEWQVTSENTHLGSSNAFEQTEDPVSKDTDDISDERLDELLGDS
jgi:hypothetical protein